MIGMLGILVLDARKLSDYVREHVQLTVFLKDEAGKPEVDALQQLISESAFTRSVRYISKEEALDSLKKELGEDATGMLESNPLPASLDIRVKAEYTDPDSLEAIRTSLSGNDKIVQEVIYQRSQVDQINRNFRTVALGLAAFSILLLLVAVALINNTIRLSLYSSRFLIKSMQLVGATRNFIRWPFLKRSFAYGLTAGLFALILLSGIVYLIAVKFPDFGQLSDTQSLLILFGTILVSGILLSGISTYFAVNKYLRLKLDELY